MRPTQRPGLAQGPLESSDRGGKPQMTEQGPSQYPSAGRAGEATTGGGGGFILFAGLVMVRVGIWQALEGVIAILENEFYVAPRNYLFQFDATTWGWIHLLVGL